MESGKQEVSCLILGERNFSGRSFWLGGDSLDSNTETSGPTEVNSECEETAQSD